MGLLRKAARAVLVDDTNASRPVAPSRAGIPVGLLRRSLWFRSGRDAAGESRLVAGVEVIPESAFSPSAEKIAQLTVDDVKALGNGVELPSRLFTALRKRLSIQKGALLLYDPVRLEYAPWASFGLDQTTLHRMRIPLGANDAFNALANGQPFAVAQPEQKSTFQRFFSSREFSSLERIVLSPFIFEDTLVGVLLATEIRHPFADTARLLACLGLVSGQLAPLLQKARGFLMKWSPAKIARPPATPEEQLARLLQSPAAQGRKFLLLSLTLDAYIEGIAASHEDLDPFRLREDIRFFIDAFLADLGVAVMLPAGALLVCLQGVPREDMDLFLHQLRYFLSRHFPSTENGSGIQAGKSRLWPDEGTDVRELISFFS